jgi:hypothetical protein
MSKRLVSVVLGLVGVVAACGGDDGGTTADAPVVATTVTVTGTTSDVTGSGRTPVSGVTVSAFKEGDTTPLVTTTSDAQGNYTLMIATNGTALDGYLLGKLAGKKDNYLYPPKPLTADIPSAPVLVISQNTFNLLAVAAQTSQDSTKGWVGVQVFDSANMPVMGATVTSSPAGTVRYNSSGGTPSSSATVTAADGIAYIFNVAAGNVTISASGGGLTFFSHPVNARANQVTTTLIQP